MAGAGHSQRDRAFPLTFTVVMTVLVVVPQFISVPFTMNVLNLFCIWSIMGLGWNFIGGYTGQVSNGHALFFAVGAYVGGLSLKWYGLTPWISMWLGVIIAGAMAYVIGKPLLRLRGHYFAIATMALVECARIIFLNWNWIGGATGVSFQMRRLSPWFTMQFKSKHDFYYICLGFLALFIILTRMMERSKFGYCCRAIKANQESAESSGVDAARYKRR
ncbi:MAG: branched-chain amino acid ABC transporter permease, partial [Planctomycetota bacterium]|nr:branched-chain amino acid ABC transporter permease [Planctomycetota bacterium]